MVQANDPAIDELLRALHRVIKATKSTVAADPLDRAAIFVLSRLKESGPTRLSDLAADLLLDISTVSRQARALEDQGLITRSGDPTDGRAVRLDLAPAGLEVLHAAWSRRNRWLATALDDWTEADRAALVVALNRFADALSAEPAPVRPATAPSSATATTADAADTPAPTAATTATTATTRETIA